MNSVFLIISLALYSTLFSLPIQYTLEEDKMYISIGSEAFLINLFESIVTQELISLLPQKTKFKEENGKIILPLNVKIETENYFSGEKFSNKANIGDLFLYKGKEIILITEPKKFWEINSDYIKIGHTNQIGELISSSASTVEVKCNMSLCAHSNRLDYSELVNMDIIQDVIKGITTFSKFI